MEVQDVAAVVVDAIRPFIIAMIDEPEFLKIDTTIARQIILVTIDCAEDDRGKIIGRHGLHAGAIRTIVNAMCSRYGYRSMIDIVDSRR